VIEHIHPYNTLAKAKKALDIAEQDVIDDQGEELAEDGYHDIVISIGFSCTPAVRRELYRITGVDRDDD